MTQAQPALKGKFVTAKITRRVDITHDLWKIWLRADEHFEFKPGQYCTIGTGGIERPYSIVSSPDEPEIELFIELVPPPDGNLTPLLHELPEGSSVSLRPRAKGLFVLKPEFKNHVMVGTVTGVVPYVSMLRKWLNDPAWPEGGKDGHRFFVLEGASYMDEFGYDEELSRYAAQHENIEFYPSCSRPDEARNRGWKGPRGRINTLVEKFISDRGLKPEETIIYACGHPQMIEDVRRRFEGTGYHFEEERFWKDD
jgi:ferredoxin--NADP+ reductase